MERTNVCETIRELIEIAYDELISDDCPIRQYIIDVQKDVDNNTLTVRWIEPIPAFYIGMEIGGLLWWISESLRYIKFLSYSTPGSNVVKIEMKPTEIGCTPTHVAKTIDDFLYRAPLMGINKVREQRVDDDVMMFFKIPLNEFQPGLIVGLLTIDDNKPLCTTLIGDVLEIKYQYKE